MKNGFFIVMIACLLCSPVLSGAQEKGPTEVRYIDYRGDLNKNILIGMSLEDPHDRKKIQGVYFYRKFLQDLHLEGEFVGERDLVLRERAADGTSGGVFTLRFLDRDPRGNFGSARLDKEVLVGEWTGADGKRRYPVYLRQTGTTRLIPGQGRYAVAGAEDDALVERNARAFLEAVLAGKRATAGRYVAYPVAFFQNGQRKTAANQAEFLRYYDAIFTRNFINRIAKGIPHHMFANAEGIMMADGAVWFDEQGKVKQLNNILP